MKAVIYKDNKIKKIISFNGSAEKLKNIISDGDEYKIFENIKDMSAADIRAIREDGSVMALEEQIKNKIIVLKKDEEIRDGQIYKLDKNIQEDLIKLIELGIEKLEDGKIIDTFEDGKKYIRAKNYKELYKDKLITKDEYNQHIIKQRESLYITELDGKRSELLDEVLENLASQNLLTDEQLEKLELLTILRQAIKEKYKKIIN